MNPKHLIPILLLPSCIIAVPAAAMMLRAEGWAWSLADFVIMWVMLATAIATYKLVTNQSTRFAYRIGVGLAVATAVILVWINGAVGIIGSEDNPANLMYGGVLLIGLIGAAIARLQASGLVWALAATAATQFLVPIVALIIWRPDFSPGVVQVIGLNFGFVLMFAGSALLFRHAARA